MKVRLTSSYGIPRPGTGRVFYLGPGEVEVVPDEEFWEKPTRQTIPKKYAGLGLPVDDPQPARKAKTSAVKKEEKAETHEDSGETEEEETLEDSDENEESHDPEDLDSEEAEEPEKPSPTARRKAGRPRKRGR